MFTWLTGSETEPPVLLRLRSSRAFIITTIAGAIFTDLFAYGIVVPVLPFVLTTRAEISEDMIQTWVSIFLAVYGAALLLAAPVCGWFADRISSRRTPLLIGLVMLGASTAMLCVGSGIEVMLIGRILQGASAAVVWVVGLALLVDTTGPDHVGQVMGYVGLSMSLAVMLAPLLGGVVFELAGYYSVFAMAFGLIAVDIFLRIVMIEKKCARKWMAKEQVLGVENETELPTARDIEPMRRTDNVNWEAKDQQMSPRTHQPDASEPAQRDSNQAIIPVPKEGIAAKLPPVVFLLASRRVSNALWAVLIQSSLITSFDALLPLFVRDTFGWNSVGAGLIFLPIVVASFLGPVVGYFSDRYGARWLATAGFILGCPFLILLKMVTENTLEQKVLLCALLALLGVCLTLMLTPIMAEVAYSVEAKAQRHPPGFFGPYGAYAQAYSLFNVAWAAGSMIGPLLGGLIRQRRDWGTTTLILGCVSAFTALPTAYWTGGSLRKAWAKRQSSGGGGVTSSEENSRIA